MPRQELDPTGAEPFGAQARLDGRLPWGGHLRRRGEERT